MQKRVTACLACIALSGCAGSGEGLDANGRPLEDSEGGDVLTANLASIQTHVFTPMCTNCHSGAAAPLGLRLDEGVSYAMLVNAPSVEAPALLRVAPGDPDASYLIHKLEGTAQVGGRMPLNGPALPAETIAVIRQWIAEGAQAPSQDASSSVPSLTAVWPMQRMSSHEHIVVVADRELDATLLAAGTITLRKTDEAAERALVQGLDLPRIELRSQLPTVVAIAPPDGGWARGAYELRISGNAPLAVADLNSRAIDGDGDGIAGGDFVLTFKVEETR